MLSKKERLQKLEASLAFMTGPRKQLSPADWSSEDLLKVATGECPDSLTNMIDQTNWGGRLSGLNESELKEIRDLSLSILPSDLIDCWSVDK